MASAYPGGLDALATNKADSTAMASDHAAHHNDMADAINKIEAKLGIGDDIPVVGDLVVRGGSPHFNIAAFGAGVGQGTVTIDRAAAVDALAAAAAAGGGVVFSDRPLLIDSVLTIPDFVHVRGSGEISRFRATGNNFVFKFNPGNRSSVAGVLIDAASQQASGGAFDFTTAQFNVRIDDTYLGNNLFTSFDIRPDESSGHFHISRVKWNGVSGCTNGILLGDGTNLVAQVTLERLLGVAASGTGMTTWMTIKNNVDTLHGDDVTFYRGVNGIVAGEAATGAVTDAVFEQMVLDTITNIALNISKSRGFDWAGVISTCGTGMNVGANALGLVARGKVQNCTDDGVVIQSGAAHLDFDMTVSDNNTSNGAFGQGYDIVGGAQHVKIRGRIGNGILLSSGHQKYGVFGSAGGSDNVDIDAECVGNETAPVDISAFTGGKKRVRGLGLTIPTVASGSTITLPGNEVVKISGTTAVDTITASYPGDRVTLIFTSTAGLNDGTGNLKLPASFTATADDAYTLVCDGISWFAASPAAVN